MKYQEVNGDLIKLAQNGEFDVIAHGCNCFCTMGAGVAVPMRKAFGCDKFVLEQAIHRGDFNKLGCIDYRTMSKDGKVLSKYHGLFTEETPLAVVNCYTQYEFGRQQRQLDYEALTLCLRKMNHEFAGKHIGLPKIGCSLAGGDWNIVKEIIKKELHNCYITVVIFEDDAK